jgi:hypothetical protein
MLAGRVQCTQYKPQAASVLSGNSQRQPVADVPFASAATPHVRTCKTTLVLGRSHYTHRSWADVPNAQPVRWAAQKGTSLQGILPHQLCGSAGVSRHSGSDRMLLEQPCCVRRCLKTPECLQNT